jgi:hypothetical protein
MELIAGRRHRAGFREAYLYHHSTVQSVQSLKRMTEQWVEKVE